MRNPRSFTQPLAIGAPDPVLEVPFRPSRMIHFFDPSNPRMAAKVPDIARKVDILLANLEDAIEVENKVAAREGLVKIARQTDFGDTQFWARVNSLDSPWFLDDLLTVVGEAGDKLDVVMIPKVEGPWDIHFVDQLLAPRRERPVARARDVDRLGVPQEPAPDRRHLQRLESPVEHPHVVQHPVQIGAGARRTQEKRHRAGHVPGDLQCLGGHHRLAIEICVQLVVGPIDDHRHVMPLVRSDQVVGELHPLEISRHVLGLEV